MADQTFLKHINLAKILNAIRLHAPISRSEIAKVVGLDKKSVSNLLASPIAEGLVVETGQRKADKGRPHTMLSFREDSHLVFGIAITETAVIAHILDLFGNVKSTHEVEFGLGASRDHILAVVRRIYQQMAKNAEGKIHGVGVSIPGVVNLETGEIKHSVNIPAFNNLNLRNELEQFIDESLLLEESSRSTALAEKWFGLGRETNNFVCVNLGVGIGAGLVHEGRLFPGNMQYMGEIGHTMVERGGRVCSCGKRGCLESYLSTTALLQEINLADKSSFKAITEIQKPSAKAAAIMKNAAYLLGVALSYVVNIVCPPLIVINGPLMRFENLLMPEIVLGINECALKDCAENTRVQASKLDNAATLGAAARVFSELFEVTGHFYV